MSYVAGKGGTIPFSKEPMFLEIDGENYYAIFCDKILEWKYYYELSMSNELYPTALELTLSVNYVEKVADDNPLKGFTNKQLTDELSRRLKTQNQYHRRIRWKKNDLKQYSYSSATADSSE